MTSGRLQHRTKGNGARRRIRGRDVSLAKSIAAEKVGVGLQHVVQCPNVTGRTKERIAQSKRARGGSVAIAD